MPATLRSRSLLASVVLASLHGVSPALAQTPPAAKPTEPAATAQTAESIVVQGQFLGAGAQSAMKLDIPVRDTPFTVESYTGSFMKAIETATVADLYNYMNGVKKSGNTGYDLSMRGFKTSGTDKNAIMVDGLPGLTGRFGSPSTIGVDHIEVVKGPMSLLYGQIQPGGFVNIITKKPMATQLATIDIKGSTYTGHGVNFGDRNGLNLAGDITGPINTDSSLMYRLVGEGTDRKGFRYRTYERGDYIAPSITWNLSDVTFLTAQVEHRDVKTSFDIGLAAFNRDIRNVAGITTRYQEPDDFRKEKGNTLSVSFVHGINDDWNWNNGLRLVKNNSSQEEFSTIGFRNATTATRRARILDIERTYKFFDTNLVGGFDTGGVKHKLIVGANGGQDTDDENRKKFFNSGPCPGPTCLDIDLYNPVYGRVPDIHSLPDFLPGQANLLTDQYFDAKAYGLYASDLIALADQWKLALGVRKAHERQVIYDKRIVATPTTIKTTSKNALPTAGLLFQPDKHWSLYASYASSYVPAPANSQDVDGNNAFLPTEGRLYETGAKVERLLDGKLNATVSVYKIDRKNALQDFACTRGTCQSQVGAEQSKGVEFEGVLRPLKPWQIVLNYAYTNATIKSAFDPIQVGARLTNVAKNSANLWSRYDIPGGALKGLGVGLGVIYTGERTGTLPTTAGTATSTTGPTVLILPAYTVVDLAFYYVWDRYALNLKMGNLFDKTYYESAGQTGTVQVAPGAPRSVTLSVRVNF